METLIPVIDVSMVDEGQRRFVVRHVTREKGKWRWISKTCLPLMAGKDKTMPISDLIGSSSSFRAVLEDVRTVASADCAVLIQGETGTGKELIAQAIHDASPRRQHRFVAINCAAIPAALLDKRAFRA